MTIIKIIAFVIFIISCIAIYHNTNSFEQKSRIILILVSMVVMYILTSIICQMCLNGIKVQNEYAVRDTVSVIKMIFTPINAMVIVAPIGNLFGKLKDQTITPEKARRRFIILIIAIVVVIIFETNYIGDFITNLLRLV